MATIDVVLPHHRYTVLVEPGCLARLGAEVHAVAPHGRCALLSDREVFRIYGNDAAASLAQAGYTVAVHPFDAGEERKNLDTVAGLYDVLLDAHLQRRSPVIALGGGVCGDTVGFVAATYLRGVPFVQVPTTLLAMVDSSVGGKVGVNVPQGKNLVGAFHQPVRVVVDPEVLRTLPPRELRCGLAECVKHALIADAALFAWTEDNLDRILGLDAEVLAELVRRNVAIKAAVVMEDEREQSVRALLNLGHTFGHAIEVTTGYGVFLHGEAVAMGLVAAAALSEAETRCAPGVDQRVRGLLQRIGLPVRAELPATADLMQAMKFDKKVQDDRLRLIVLDAIGKAAIADDIAPAAVERAWETIRA